MLIDEFTLVRLSPTRARLAWAATAGRVYSVFVSGAAACFDRPAAATTETLDIDLADDGAAAIEVHEFTASGEAEAAIYPDAARLRQPLIYWDAWAAAEHYRIYHQLGDGAETLWFTRPARAGIGQYAVQLPQALAPGWHFFRVEAVDAYGHESTRLLWPHFVYALPTPPVGVALAPDGDHFKLTLTF